MVAVVVAALCFGVSAIFGKVAFGQGLETFSLLAVRFSIAAVLFWVYLWLVRPGALVAGPSRILAYLLIGVFIFGGSSVLFYSSLRMLDASVAIMLLYGFPVIVVIAERVLYGQPITLTRFAAVLIILLGIFLLVKAYDPRGVVSPAGIALGLGAAVAYAAFTLIGARYLATDREQATAYMITFLAIALLFVRPPWVIATQSWDRTAVLAVVLLGAVSTFGALTLYFIGLQRLGAAQSSLISSLEPLFTLVLAFFFLGERLGLIQLLGGVLVIGGVVLSEIGVGSDRDIFSAQM